jgi:C1A family cysteine protease
MNKKHYGWKPDKPDFRDRPYTSIKPRFLLSKLPPRVDLREGMPPIWDQGELGSCTAQSIAAALMFNRKLTNETPDFVPSRLFIYYNERVVEGTVNEDAGAEIRTGIKTITKTGFCREDLWKYDIPRFKRRPPSAAYKNAELYKAVEYFRLDNEKPNALKICLATGFPFVFGFSVYVNALEAAEKNGGYIPMPQMDDSMDGGHAVVCCGYDDSKKVFIIHNSWGTEVGDKGYYYMPYDYVCNKALSEDFWTIRKIRETD